MSDTIAGRYTLIDPIARGGSGTVWRAWDQRRNKVCAAKVLRQRDSADLLRFVREQSVKIDHPHVLAPYGWAAEDEHVVIAMDLSDGGTLESVIRDHGAFSDRVAEEILRQLISALHFVHSEGWIHRDVKPANLMMDATGTGRPRARLADFGIATQGEDARLTRIGTVVGTPGYIAPELLRGADPDPSQDLFAAGVVAMRMVRPDADRGTAPAPEDAFEVFGEDSLLGAEVAALLDADPSVRHDGALSLMERLEPTADADFGEATTRDGEIVEIFQTLDPLPEAWQDIVAGFAQPPRQERTGENIAQAADAGERTPQSVATGPQPAGGQIEAPPGGRLHEHPDAAVPPGGEPLVGPASGPAGTALRGMPSGMDRSGYAVPAQAPPIDGEAAAAVQGPLPEGQRSRAGLLGATPAMTGPQRAAPQRSISWAGSQTPVGEASAHGSATGFAAAAGAGSATLRENTLRTPAEARTAAGGAAAAVGYAEDPHGPHGGGTHPVAAPASALGVQDGPREGVHPGQGSGATAAGASRGGPLSAIGVGGAAGWAVLGVLALLLAAVVVLVVILVNGAGGGAVDPAEPTPEPTASQSATSVPTTTVTPGPEDGLNGTQLGSGQDTGNQLDGG
ncbi:serine/threonine-protein kinase [Kocuria palustris]|uniref:protein kinase domain-containing protein n=1 Tax=Kocuria palustris TaxID=71999 RepID=UPI0016432363|nr:serine/threonine-protein kinase [Kocuria palustris]